MIPVLLAVLASCGSSSSTEGPGAEPPVDPSAGHGPSAIDRPPFEAGAFGPDGGHPGDEGPPAGEAPPEPVPMPADSLAARLAPHVHLHPDDRYRPASVDWYLARVSMRFHHDNCPDHEILPLGKVTQQSLVAAQHEDNESFCRHDAAKRVASAESDLFFLEVADHAAYAGAPRAAWKTYLVSGARADGLVDLEYWFFYPFNDNTAMFDHESDWEHVRITADPKTEKPVEVKLSQHHWGDVLSATDPKLKWNGTHPVVYSAKGTHANFAAPGSFPIPGVPFDLAKDDTKAAAPGDVWKTEYALVEVGTRAAPKNGQTFIRFRGRWGEIGDLPETSGVLRSFR